MQAGEGTELERSSRGEAGREPSLSVSSPFLLAPVLSNYHDCSCSCPAGLSVKELIAV